MSNKSVIKRDTNITYEDETNLDTYSRDLSHQLLEELFLVVKEEGDRLGKDFEDQTMMTVLASMICTLIYNKLKEQPKGVSLEKANNEYKDLKQAIQTTIASGFQGAFDLFAGQDIEYYCQINPIPESANKLAC